MKKFEAYLTPDFQVEVNFPDEGRTILLESVEGRDFARELVAEFGRLHPKAMVAVEQKVKQSNRSLFAMMRENRSLYVMQTAKVICSCCFGERDHIADYDPALQRFRMERPKGCREAGQCPWNGFHERNRDSFFVVCGAKREYGFTPTERRIVLLAKQGFVNPSVVAEVMGVTQKSVWNALSSVYRKTGTGGMPELLMRVKDEMV